MSCGPFLFLHKDPLSAVRANHYFSVVVHSGFDMFVESGEKCGDWLYAENSVNAKAAIQVTHFQMKTRIQGHSLTSVYKKVFDQVLGLDFFFLFLGNIFCISLEKSLSLT